MFFLRRCINQSIRYLRLYRSLYSNTNFRHACLALVPRLAAHRRTVIRRNVGYLPLILPENVSLVFLFLFIHYAGIYGSIKGEDCELIVLQHYTGARSLYIQEGRRDKGRKTAPSRCSGTQSCPDATSSPSSPDAHYSDTLLACDLGRS